MKQNDSAILLHRVNYSDTSLIVTMYTLHHGVQKFIFQGGKKKATSLFPFSVCEIEYYNRPDSELGKLTSVTSNEASLANISDNPVKNTIAFFATDILRKCLLTNQADFQLFEFIRSSITRLYQTKDTSLFMVWFLIEFAEQLGIQPNVTSENSPFFNLQEGEFCLFKIPGELIVEGESVKLIQELIRNNEIGPTPKTIRMEALEVMLRYYTLHIPKFNIQKSLEIVRDILYD